MDAATIDKITKILMSGHGFVGVAAQEGEGCDYTIGCGVRIEPIEAANMEEALERWRDKFYEPGTKTENDHEKPSLLLVISQNGMGIQNVETLRKRRAGSSSPDSSMWGEAMIVGDA